MNTYNDIDADFILNTATFKLSKTARWCEQTDRLLNKEEVVALIPAEELKKIKTEAMKIEDSFGFFFLDRNDRNAPVVKIEFPEDQILFHLRGK